MSADRCNRCDRVLMPKGPALMNGEARRGAKGLCSGCYAAVKTRASVRGTPDGSAMVRAARTAQAVEGVPVYVTEEQCDRVRALLVRAGLADAVPMLGLEVPS